MAGARTRWLAGMCAAVIALLSAAACSSTSPPTVNPAQARAMQPVIDAYLASPVGGNSGGILHDLYPKLKPRVFCSAAIIEIRPAGGLLRVGMETSCGEYARRGRTLLAGTAGGTEEIMTLTHAGGRYHVQSAAAGPTWHDPGWVRRHFSPAAAAEINANSAPNPPDPISQAWRAFGFPAGTRAVAP